MKVITVIGARPEFVQATAVSRRLRERHHEVLVHTGQHYDDELSSIFVNELDIPSPEYELGIGGGSNTEQVSRMLSALSEVYDREAPDAVLVYGDTNSTFAGGLAAAQRRVPVAHVEAGMRSFDRSMPEELNRVLTDHLSDLLLCSCRSAMANLERENAAGRVVLTGDVMADVAAEVEPRARANTELLDRLGVESGSFVLSTAHRAGNVDDPARLALLVALYEAVPLPVVLPLHPRTRSRLEASGLMDRLEKAPHVHLVAPLGYVDFTTFLVHAHRVLTDSGGVQKQAYFAHVPCVTMRAATEWVETVEVGWNQLVDLDADAAVAALEKEPPSEHPQLYGEGAGRNVVDALSELS